MIRSEGLLRDGWLDMRQNRSQTLTAAQVVVSFRR
jgi:16S rRNA C1402 N4-methylase RsmH